LTRAAIATKKGKRVGIVSSSVSRVFTPEEANRLVPKLREMLSRMQEVKTSIAHTSGLARSELVDELGTLVSRFEEMGVELKDMDSGLIDFPALRFGDPVYLCWKLGEREVMYWHGLTEGFRGRKLLRPEVAQIR
jgi:hypothetical protein